MHWSDRTIFRSYKYKPRSPDFVAGKKAYLYLLKSTDGRFVKIGISNNYVERIKRLRWKTPFNFKHAGLYPYDGSYIRQIESFLHNQFDRAYFSGFDGAREWFFNTSELEAVCHQFNYQGS